MKLAENRLQRSHAHGRRHDLPEFIIELLTALDGCDSPIDMTQTNATLGIEPTHLADFVNTLASLPTTTSQTKTGH